MSHIEPSAVAMSDPVAMCIDPEGRDVCDLTVTRGRLHPTEPITVTLDNRKGMFRPIHTYGAGEWLRGAGITLTDWQDRVMAVFVVPRYVVTGVPTERQKRLSRMRAAYRRRRR